MLALATQHLTLIESERRAGRSNAGLGQYPEPVFLCSLCYRGNTVFVRRAWPDGSGPEARDWPQAIATEGHRRQRIEANECPNSSRNRHRHSSRLRCLGRLRNLLKTRRPSPTMQRTRLITFRAGSCAWNCFCASCCACISAWRCATHRGRILSGIRTPSFCSFPGWETLPRPAPCAASFRGWVC